MEYGVLPVNWLPPFMRLRLTSRPLFLSARRRLDFNAFPLVCALVIAVDFFLFDFGFVQSLSVDLFMT